MVKKITGEVWKPLQFPGWKHLRKKYALSSHGRIASYYADVTADGKLLEGSIRPATEPLTCTGPATTERSTFTVSWQDCSSQKNHPSTSM